jgi:hypothetical protein
MPYCPNCKTEYREGFKRCTDCDTELEAELAQEASYGSTRKSKSILVISFVVVYVLTVLIFAFLLKNGADELASNNKNFNIMAKRAADSIAENDKLRQENADLKNQLQAVTSEINQKGGLMPHTDAFGAEDIIVIQKLDYKNFNYTNYKGRGAQIEITIKNLTRKSFPVNSLKFKALTNQQRTVPRSGEILVSYEMETKSKVGFDLVDLEPDTQTEGTIFFELKGGETILTLMYDDLQIPIEK